MPKHSRDLMSPDDFKKLAELDKFRWTNRINDNHPLWKIYVALDEYAFIMGQPYGVAQIAARHKWIIEVASGCADYYESKPKADRTSKKVLSIVALGNKAQVLYLYEKDKAKRLAQQMDSSIRPATIGTRAITGIRVGNEKSHEQDNRFERLNKAGGMGAIKGDFLVDFAKDTLKITMTQNAEDDYYVLKQVLKGLRSNNRELLSLKYLSEDERAEHQLTFTANTVYRNGVPWNPESTDGDLLYACSLDGIFYAMSLRPDIQGLPNWYHHSSFLAGGDALCAGTFSIKNGKVKWISNNSGHYAPTIENLIDACVALDHAGYNCRDSYAFYYDFGKVFSPGIGKYIIPIHQLIEQGKRLHQPADFLIDNVGDRNNEVFQYIKPLAAQARGCREFLGWSWTSST